jgi:hypothetical protein
MSYKNNFQKEWCTFGRKKKHLKYPFLRFECFEYAKTFFDLCQTLNVKFEINGKYSKKNYDNLNYYASLVIFQT